MVVWLCFFLTLGEVLEGFLIYIYIIDVFFQIKVEQKIMIVS